MKQNQTKKLKSWWNVKSLNMLFLDGETKEFAHVPNELEHVS